MTPNRRPQTAAQAEHKLLSAILRLRENNSHSNTLKRRTKTGPVTVNVTNVCIEAGLARSYPYKNKDYLPRFWEEMSAAASARRVRSSVKTSQARATGADALRRDRDLAINAAGRLLQVMDQMRDDIADLKRLAAQADWDTLARRLQRMG